MVDLKAYGKLLRTNDEREFIGLSPLGWGDDVKGRLNDP